MGQGGGLRPQQQVVPLQVVKDQPPGLQAGQLEVVEAAQLGGCVSSRPSPHSRADGHRRDDRVLGEAGQGLVSGQLIVSQRGGGHLQGLEGVGIGVAGEHLARSGQPRRHRLPALAVPGRWRHPPGPPPAPPARWPPAPCLDSGGRLVAVSLVSRASSSRAAAGLSTSRATVVAPRRSSSTGSRVVTSSRPWGPVTWKPWAAPRDHTSSTTTRHCCSAASSLSTFTPCSGRPDGVGVPTQPSRQLALRPDHVGPLPEGHPEDPVGEVGEGRRVAGQLGGEHGLADAAPAVQPQRRGCADDPHRAGQARGEGRAQPVEILGSGDEGARSGGNRAEHLGPSSGKELRSHGGGPVGGGGRTGPRAGSLRPHEALSTATSLTAPG